LSQLLHLSEGRTSHLVREECGKPFSKLFTGFRIKAAASFLRNTTMPMAEIAVLNILKVLEGEKAPNCVNPECYV